MPYSGCPLDRASGRRADSAWIAGLLGDGAGARLIPVWRDHCLVSGDPPAPVLAAAASRRAMLCELSEPVFLGLDGAAGVFAVDLSALSQTDAIAAAGAEQVLDVRRLAGSISAADAAVLGYARGLLYWHRHQRFCGTCGATTRAGAGGHLRVCGREDCAQEHYPRIAPAVIMLVESPVTSQQASPGRCLLARHRGSAPDSYSTLAGFVEVGESLEDAVRREVAEETGVPVGKVNYVASQAWPFPAGLMAGFRAQALATTIHPDGDEILEARWFTRAELAEREAAGRPLGRPDSIDRHLLRSWLTDAGTGTPPG
jgi:NAD+ diphosphatase